MEKTVTMKLFSLLRWIGRWVLSNWLLIIILSCITVYLIFPSPLDSLSYVLWPDPKKGPLTQTGIVQLSYTVSGATTYPGIVSLNIKVTNTDSLAHDFVIFAVIGSQADRIWFGPGYYMDFLSPASDVQFAPDPFYSRAFISTGSLKPGQSYQVTRKIQILNNPSITDALVDVRDKLDASKTLAFDLRPKVIK